MALIVYKPGTTFPGNIILHVKIVSLMGVVSFSSEYSG
jgi:hypothetical protein